MGDLAVRRIADRYEVRPLEGGGMGVVWQGYDTVLDRLVAIKQIRADEFQPATTRAELAERFRREARITAKIEHPGVPAVYDAAIDRDTDSVEQLYLVMQLVRGITVADILAEEGPLPVPWAVAIAAQICSVLSHAHAIPVVHRDLKPSNVMVDRSGHVKVLDFGVAAVLGTDVTQLTETGQLVGSRDYMSPEQFHGVGVSPRSDLYAVGCLLHEMLTASKVFDSAGDPALQHVHGRPTPIRVLRPEVDPAIERLVLDLLEKSPDHRPASAQDVYDRLAPFLPASGSGSGSGSGLDGDPTRPFRAPLAPRRHLLPAPSSWPADPVVDPAFDPVGAPVAAPELAVPGWLANALDEAEARAADLIDDDRFSQAVAVLDDAAASAARHLAADHLAARHLAVDHPRLLDLRSVRAAALFLGGDFRQALSAFQDLARAYARTAARIVGPRDDERVIECRRQAAYCHAELGDNEAALGELIALLDLARLGTGGDRGEEALELRHRIGIVLLAAHRLGEAAGVLGALHDDLVAARGPDDPSTQDVRDLLARLRLAG